MAERHRAIIIDNDEIVVMKREKNGKLFYVFPGGAKEENESQEECCVREVKEEFGIDVEVVNKIYDVKIENENQGFFVCKWKSGKIHKTDAEEYTTNDVSKYGTYEPATLKLYELQQVPVYPCEVTSQLLKDLQTYGTKLNRPCIKIDCKWVK